MDVTSIPAARSVWSRQGSVWSRKGSVGAARIGWSGGTAAAARFAAPSVLARRARRAAGWSNRRMSNVSDDIEQRLAAAAQAMSEREVTSQRQEQVSGRQRDLEAELAALQDQAKAERKDVERLEGMSLGRVLAS